MLARAAPTLSPHRVCSHKSHATSSKPLREREVATYSRMLGKKPLRFTQTFPSQLVPVLGITLDELCDPHPPDGLAHRVWVSPVHRLGERHQEQRLGVVALEEDNGLFL